MIRRGEFKPDEANASKQKQFSQIPCSVCGASSSGYHFGAISCESCKVFFSRSLKRPCLDQQTRAPYVHRCSLYAAAPTTPNCQRCRFDKCLAAGMSVTAICIGRHSAERRIQNAIYVNKLAEKNQLLAGHVSGRRRRIVTSSSPYDVAARKYEVSSTSRTNLNSIDETGEAGPSQTYALQYRPISTTPPSRVKLVNECGFLHQDDISTDIEQILQQSVDALNHLSVIRSVPNLPIFTNDMTSEAIWIQLMSGHDSFANIVRTFIRALPYFGRITNLSDRVRLFNAAFHPIYTTHLSLDFDAFNHAPRFLTVQPGMSQKLVMQRFPIFRNILNELTDSGFAITSAQLSTVELVLLCALIYFNPDPQPRAVEQSETPPPNAEKVPYINTRESGNEMLPSRLVDSRQVQIISTKYWHALQRFINSTFPPEVASRRLGVFQQLLDYFRNNTAALHHQCIVALAEQFPFTVVYGRIFADSVAKLLADKSASPTSSDKPFGDQELSPPTSTNIAVKFEPTYIR